MNKPPFSFEEPTKPQLLKRSDLFLLKLNDLPKDRNDLKNELFKRNHKCCGQGTFAVVIEHPESSDSVVRISSRNDGWIDYALKNHGNPYAPRLFSIGYNCGLWISVSERLTAVCGLSFSDDRIKLAIDSMVMMNKRIKKEVPANGFSSQELEMHKGWEGLTNFLTQFFGINDCDLKEANIMMRGKFPVANDPIDNMDEEVAREHEARWMITN